MRVITEPTVRLLSAPMYYPIPECELPPHAGDEENIIAVAGKVCYDSYGKDGRSVQDHVRGLTKEGHGSVFEHVNVGLFIAGVSRGLTHELVRHRAGFAYSQRSTRFAREDDANIVLAPEYARRYEAMMSSDEAQRSMVSSDDVRLVNGHIASFRQDCAVYLEHVELWLKQAPEYMSPVQKRKWARGNARQNLPHSLETRLVVTANIRSWRTFMNKRSHRAAEAEIRRLADCVWPIIREVAPDCFVDCKVDSYDGYIEVTCPQI